MSQLLEAGRAFFTHNLGLKLTALVVALVLFSAVRGAEDAQRSVFVDVVATLPTAETPMMLISQPPDQVRLTLRGPRSQINAIQSEDLRPVVVDLTDPNQRYYYFADDDFDVPTGVTITQVAPTSVPLEWARRAERTLPVQPRLVAEPTEGFVLSEPARAEPGEVLVVGPEQEVATLRTVQTEPISLDGLTAGRHELRIPLMGPPPHTRYDEASVTVVLNVVPDRAERTIAGIQVVLPEGFTVMPQRVSLVVEGIPTAVSAVDAAALTATVDVASVRDDGQLQVEIRGLPSNVTLIRIEPATVQLAM